MSDCKDCNCTMKYVDKLFNNNMKNSKNILCKKNNTTLKFIMPFEVLFYITSFSLFSLFSFYNYSKNKKLVYING